MRILFLTNYYPPYESGGQGKSCQQVVEGLRQRDHQTLVLTSTHRTDNRRLVEEGVIRGLYPEMDLDSLKNSYIVFTGKTREQANLRLLESTVESFDPDLIFIWGMWNLHRSLAVRSESLLPGRVVYRFAEYWPTLPSQQEIYWKTPGRGRRNRLLKKILAPVALSVLARDRRDQRLKIQHAICVSAATREALVSAGVPVEHARIIHTGIRLHDAGAIEETVPKDHPERLELLIAGRLTAEKGIETAIRALAVLASRYADPRPHLTIAGSGTPQYEQHLRELIAEYRLDDFVTFLGQVPYDEMPGLFRRSEVLLVPSVWQEPFARVVLEGMAHGLVVIASEIGGNKEVIVDRVNGLLFPPGDSDALANCIAGISSNPEMRHSLKRAARACIHDKYTFEKMLDQIEGYLEEVKSGSQQVVVGRG